MSNESRGLEQVPEDEPRAASVLADLLIASRQAREASSPCSCPDHQSDPNLPPHGQEFPPEQRSAWHSGYVWGQRSIVKTLLSDAKAQVETVRLSAVMDERKRLAQLLQAAFEHVSEDEATAELMFGISYAIDIVGDPDQWAFLLSIVSAGTEIAPDDAGV